MTIADIWDTYGTGYPGKGKNAPVAAPVSDGLFGSTPNPGQGAFGKVPGSVDIPASVTSGIKRDLSGIISPEVQAKLQSIAATFGIRSGMPGSGLQSNRYAHDYLGASDVARQRGFENWKSLVPLQQQNNELAAAPNPEQRALTEQSFAQQMFNQYLAAMRSGGNGGGGGSRSPAGGTIGTGNGSVAARRPPMPNLPTSPGMVLPVDNFGDMTVGQRDDYASELQDAALWSNRNDPMGDIFGGSYPDFSPPPSVGQDAIATSDSRLDPFDEYWDNMFNS